MFEAKGDGMRRVLVTGGASGIGAAVAAALELEGHSAVRADLRGSNDVQQLDVGDPGQWSAIVAANGQLDGLVNCAGVRIRTALVDLDLDEWNSVMRVNLTGTFLGVQALARSWIATNTPGAVVNIGSTTSFSAVPGQPHYCASKAGVAMFTKAAALELAEHNIRVNAVAPGPIVTPMLQTRLDESGQQEWLTSQVPLGRLGQTGDVAAAISFLLSDAASFITGVTLPVDGGWLTR
jgi:NAD(P)-dependent dehydrogenase (short-subunit alcohol dehydrogenase family)